MPFWEHLGHQEVTQAAERKVTFLAEEVRCWLIFHSVYRGNKKREREREREKDKNQSAGGLMAVRNCSGRSILAKGKFVAAMEVVSSKYFHPKWAWDKSADLWPDSAEGRLSDGSKDYLARLSCGARCVKTDFSLCDALRRRSRPPPHHFQSNLYTHALDTFNVWDEKFCWRRPPRFLKNLLGCSGLWVLFFNQLTFARSVKHAKVIFWNLNKSPMKMLAVKSIAWKRHVRRFHFSSAAVVVVILVIL